MKCYECGEENLESAYFCENCGSTLTIEKNDFVKSFNKDGIEYDFLDFPITDEGYKEAGYVSKKEFINEEKKGFSFFGYFKYFIMFLLKPFSTFNDKMDKIDTKTSIILGLIVSSIAMIISLVKSMFSIIFVKRLNLNTLKYMTLIDFSRIRSLDYVNLVFKDVLVYYGIILIIAIVYYLGSLVIKKDCEFSKVLSAAASTFLLFILTVFVVGPIFGILYRPFKVLFIIFGSLYFIITFVNLIDEILSLKQDDGKIYFHLICSSILCLGIYFFCLILNPVSNQVCGLFDLFM